MTLFDESGFFWEPFSYSRPQKSKAAEKAAVPRELPPFAPTGWTPPVDFPSLAAAKALSLDTETFDPDLRESGPGVRRNGHLVGISVATDDGQFARYYPIAHALRPEWNIPREKVFAWLREELSRPNQPKVGANLLYDLDYLAEVGVPVAGNLYDVCWADPLIYEHERSYSLDSISLRRLKGEGGKESGALYAWCAEAYGGTPNGDQRANIWRAPPELVGPYAERDAALPMLVLRQQLRELRSRGCAAVFEMESGLLPLLLQMRRRGVRVSKDRMLALDAEMTAVIKAHQQVAEGISPFASLQIAAFCEKEGISFPLTELGAPSFTKGWLAKSGHPVLLAVAELRRLLKLRDTFLRSSMQSSEINGRIHCELHPLRSDDYGTVSGRFSSSNPNLQQIPARDKLWAPRIRSCFLPDEGRVWMKNDLSQIEFRLGVHFGSGDGIEAVRERYRSDPETDFYSLCADIASIDRTPAKSIALGTLYGMQVPKLAETLGVSRSTAQGYFDSFNGALPFMQTTFNAYMTEAEETGFIRTIGGRLCHLHSGEEYKALNRKLQGSCADWIKRAMLDAYRAGIFDVLDLYLTVHDELDSGVPPTAEGADAARSLHAILCTAYPLNIPVLAGCDIGSAWGTLDDVNPSSLSASMLSACL